MQVTDVNNEETRYNIQQTDDNELMMGTPVEE